MNAPVARLTLIQRARQDLRNFLSLLVFFFATALFFRSWEFALITTASLGFHELGHAAALSWLKLEWRIAFGIVGAWTWSDAGERARLPEMANVFVHISGPFFSLVLAGAALALNRLLFPNDRHLLILANFSAQVGFLNLLPLGPVTDGGKIVRRIVASVSGKHRLHAILLPLTAATLMFTLYAWAQLPQTNGDSSSSFAVSLLLIGIWMASSMLLEAHHVERRQMAQLSRPVVQNPIPVTGMMDRSSLERASPERASPERVSQERASQERAPITVTSGAPMTIRHVALITLLLWDMLAVYLIIMIRTPFWLEPIYVEGSLKNVMDVLQWLAKLI